MFLHASALNHPVAFALCNDQSPPLLSCSCCYCTTPLSHPHCCHPPFLITFTLFSLWQNEMGRSAAAAFQHHPHADIPHHKQCLTAVSVRACMCAHLCFSPWYFVVWHTVASRVLLKRLSGICADKRGRFIPDGISSYGHLKKEQNTQKQSSTW